MATEVKHRRHRWLGMEQKRIPKKGLRWNPLCKRKQGRPMTLIKTFEEDMMELTWGTAEIEPKERHSWRCNERRRLNTINPKGYWDQVHLLVKCCLW